MQLNYLKWTSLEGFIHQLKYNKCICHNGSALWPVWFCFNSFCYHRTCLKLKNLFPQEKLLFLTKTKFSFTFWKEKVEIAFQRKCPPLINLLKYFIYYLSLLASLKMSWQGALSWRKVYQHWYALHWNYRGFNHGPHKRVLNCKN